jgi:hypothetical protein
MNTNNRPREKDLQPWEETFRGKTWKDMPGSGPDTKRMNFFLFKRGLYTPKDAEEDANPASESEEPGEEELTEPPGDGESPAQKKAGRPRKMESLVSPARRLAALREAEERRRLAAIQLPKPPPPEPIEETVSSPSTAEEPPTPEPEPEPTPVPAMNDNNAATPRQADLFKKFNEITRNAPLGFKTRFREAVGCSTSTLYLFFNDRKVADSTLDSIEKAVEDTSWLNGATAKPGRKPGADSTAAPARQPRRQRAAADEEAEVSLGELKQAIIDLETAQARFNQLAARFAKQHRAAA